MKKNRTNKKLHIRALTFVLMHCKGWKDNLQVQGYSASSDQQEAP